jgi:hypothetical protein
MSFFFLPERIFLSIEAAPKPPVQPSGLVPGWDWGGAAQLLQAIGGAQGSDRLKAFSTRVCSAKSKGYVVFFLSLGPCVNSPTAANKSPGPSGPYPLKKRSHCSGKLSPGRHVPSHIKILGY